MTNTGERLRSRAALHGLAISPADETSLSAYYDVLYRWNAKINLTALADSDAAIDRLVMEPLAAAKHLPAGGLLIDLGSGGGSPAIPLAIALRTRQLVMVESKVRKAAFLREASRVAAVTALVENGRFEEVVRTGSHVGRMSLVSIRAVKVDRSVLGTARALLRPDGLVALFTPTAASPADLPPTLRVLQIAPLIGTAHLVVLGVCST